MSDTSECTGTSRGLLQLASAVLPLQTTRGNQENLHSPCDDLFNHIKQYETRYLTLHSVPLTARLRPECPL